MAETLSFQHAFVAGTAPRTLLLLHGTGGNERDLLSLGRTLDPQATLLSPRGQVSENGRLRFFRRLANGVFDFEDLQRRTDDLAAFIREAVTTYRLDGHEIVEVGYSNGANIAASVLLRHPGLLSAAILFRALLPFEPETLPDLAGTRVWLAGGTEDQIITAAQTERLAETLRAAGAEVTAKFFEADHALTSGEFVLAQRWLAKVDS